MIKEISEKKKFSSVQFTFWCSWSAFLSFAALFFKQTGLSQSEIGFALSSSTLGGILGQFIWGFLCDRLHTVKKNFIAANIMILSAVSAFFFIRKTIWILVLMFLLGFSQIPQPSILDTWVLKKLPGKEEEYGHIRLWASIGYASSALTFGFMIRRFGFNTMFIAAPFFILTTLLVTMTLKDVTEGNNPREPLKKSLKALFSNKSYLFFIFVCFIIGLAYRTAHLLLPLIVDNVKGSSLDLGLAYFFGIITEIPMLLASKRFSKKYHSNVLLIFSAVLFMVHFLLLIIAKSPFGVIVAMFAQGLAFGNYLPSIRLFVFENAPENLRTSAQTFADAICSSLAGVIGSAAGGIIMQNYGVKVVLMAGIGLLAAALILLILNLRKHRNTSRTTVS
jgi:PPP family 3-phenylpropionic acid transporter